MRVLTTNEIHRTAFKAVERETCPYCKNRYPVIVRDPAFLAPFAKFYGETTHKVLHCDSCSAVWSAYE